MDSSIHRFHITYILETYKPQNDEFSNKNRKVNVGFLKKCKGSGRKM